MSEMPDRIYVCMYGERCNTNGENERLYRMLEAATSGIVEMNPTCLAFCEAKQGVDAEYGKFGCPGYRWVRYGLNDQSAEGVQNVISFGNDPVKAILG